MVSSQEVEDGVQAAVEAGQRPRNLVGEVDDVKRFTRDLQHPGGIVEGPRDVEGNETHGEDHQNHHDELDGLVTGGGGLPGGRQAVARSAEGPRHQAVARHDDQEGDPEQEHHDRRAVVHVLPEGVLTRGVVAQGVVVPRGRGDENQVGHQAGAHHRPHCGARHVRVAGLDPRYGLDGVADAHVAMHTDAGEEEDAAVKVGVEEEANDLAGGHTEHPVAAVGVVVDEGGEREDVEEVREGQVEHEDGAGVPWAHPDEEPQGGGVQYKAAHKDQAVGHWQQDVFELLVKSAARVKDRGGRHGLVVPTEVVDGFHGVFLPNPKAITIIDYREKERR